MSEGGYSASPSLSGLNNNIFSTAISSLRSTYQQEMALEDALHYIDSVVNSRSNSPNPACVQHEAIAMNLKDITVIDKQTQRQRSHSVTPKASPVVDTIFRPTSVDNFNINDGHISRMRSATFDESQNIAQPMPVHPPPAFLTQDLSDSNINLSGTLISLPALMDRPQSTDFPSSTDPTFVLQNIFSTNVNSMLQTKGYVPSVQVKDMGKALAAHIRTCTGSGFENEQDEHVIQMDLLARIIAYAASELNTEIADYTIASHGSTIPLLIYREVQEDWDFSGNSDNYLLTNTTHTLQDDLDEAFTNRLHKNIMTLTTPVSNFNQEDKHIIIDSIANETPLPDKWAFTNEKGHKRTTYGWLTGNNTPKKPIPPVTSLSPSLGQKRPLALVEDTENISYKERLDALKPQLPLPQSTVDANLNFWTTTVNAFLDTHRSKFMDVNPTTLRSTVFDLADKLSNEEHFMATTRSLARSKNQKALQEFEDERLQHLLHEVTTFFSNKEHHSQDAAMTDLTQELSKIDTICKSTAIWKDTAKTMWKDNILTCNQATLDQATRLLLLEDTSHKYASMPQDQIYDTETERRDQIIARITILNENATKVITDIKHKSVHTKDQEKLNLITKQGWETAKKTILQNPNKFPLNNIPVHQRVHIIRDIVEDLKENDNHDWAIKVIRDPKNKGLQSKAIEHRVTAIVRKLHQHNRQPSPSSPSPSPIEAPRDQDMPLADPTPWTETDEYKQNRKLWMDTASEIFEKLSPYFPNEERKMKEELYCEAADICAANDKDLIQLQSISSLTDSNKKRELEDMQKFLIDKEFQILLQADTRRRANENKRVFEDYLATKDFEYYVQHTREQITNPAVPLQKKAELKKLVKVTEQWTPKHRIDDDGSALPDSPPPSPPPKSKAKSKDTPSKVKSTNSKQEAEKTRKGNTPNTRHLQKLLNDMNKDNGLQIMREIHKISEKDKLANAKQQLVKHSEGSKPAPTSYAKKALSNNKDPRKDGAGGWKMVGTNKISRATILPPPPNIFKFIVTDDKNTLPSPKQTDDELTETLNNIISENMEWLLALGSNHVKTANWSKDPKAIVVTMTRNIDKNRADDLPDGETAFNALREVVLDLFPDATLANQKPRSKLRFPRVPTQHSDGLPMDNGLLYHYLRNVSSNLR
ncbi:hypothetical protein AMATHDRAFT_10980 [Amanita thiersii Skay4041]|uniref:Uncharacterized protein n=1 Tax=Amanita thiersii Skay4041 TaxID=703135 RepID=A0A2A9NAK4_9AGAR|nr:hypothetical protein AMATHDRAFT_10980 [Amanita thiersii Skay4041]